jgi:hypothetical protein
MSCSKELDQTLGTVASVLIRCFFLVFAFVLFWFLFFILTGEWGYRFHSRWFPLSFRDYVLLNYCGIAFMKICNIFLFLIPYLAIQWFLKSRRASETT